MRCPPVKIVAEKVGANSPFGSIVSTGTTDTEDKGDDSSAEGNWSLQNRRCWKLRQRNVFRKGAACALPKNIQFPEPPWPFAAGRTRPGRVRGMRRICPRNRVRPISGPISRPWRPGPSSIPERCSGKWADQRRSFSVSPPVCFTERRTAVRDRPCLPATRSDGPGATHLRGGPAAAFHGQLANNARDIDTRNAVLTLLPLISLLRHSAQPECRSAVRRAGSGAGSGLAATTAAAATGVCASKRSESSNAQ
jgi:hypothetical protein